MKKIFFIIIVAIILIIILVLLFGKGLGLGNGFGNGSSGSENAGNNEENAVSAYASTSEEKDDLNDSDENNGNNAVIVRVTVFEKEYIYENSSISLVTLMDELVKAEGNIIVEVKDDNATLNAYNKLIEELRNAGIDYKEE